MTKEVKHRRNIGKDYYPIIYEFYKAKLAEGIPITHIAKMYNKTYGTSFAESTLRNKFEVIRDSQDHREILTGLEKKEAALFAKERRLVTERHKLTRQRAAVHQEIKERAEQSLVVDIFTQLYEDDTFEPKELEFVSINDERSQGYQTVFAKSDTHLGYDYKGYYNIDEAIARTEEFYRYVAHAIKNRGLKDIVIIDGADQIEGAALRKSQLMRIVEDSTTQAKIWTSTELNCLKTLANEFPDVNIIYNMVSEDNHSQLRLHGTGRDELTDSLANVMANDIERSIMIAQSFGGMKNVSIVHASTIITNINGFKVAIAHGHQYSKQPKQLYDQIAHDFEKVDAVIVGHWHRFTTTYLNVNGDKLSCVITLPALIGDTDFGKRLHLSSYPGFVEIDFHEEDGMVKPVVHRVG